MPAYKNYIIRTRIATAYNLLSDFADKIQQETQINGSIPADITYNGVSIQNNLDTPVSNFGDITQLTYATLAGSLADDTRIRVDAKVENIPGLDSMYFRLHMAMYTDDAGIVEKFCGIYDGIAGVPPDIPLSYQPSNCQCNSVQSIILGANSC